MAAQESWGSALTNLQTFFEKFLALPPPSKFLYSSTAFLFSYIFLYIPIRFVYRVYFDPLSKIPGPKLALVSENLNKFYWILLPWNSGTEIFHLKKLHEKYGPIVRTGPRYVDFDDINTYSQIYKMNTKFPKSGDFYNHPSARESVVETLNIRDAQARRAALQPYFSKQAVRSLEGLIQSKVTYFLSRVKEIGTNVDLTRGFRCLTVDIITNYSYGKSFDAISHPTFTPGWLLAFESLLQSTAVQNVFPNTVAVLGFIFEKFLPRPVVRAISRQMADVLDFTDCCAEAVLSQKARYMAGERDMVTIFTQLFEDDVKRGRKALNDKQLTHDAIATLAAGMDTTGHALSYAIFYLVKNRDVEKRLLDELKTVMETPFSEAKEEVLDKLPFLQACIKESLRLSHGVPGPLPRDVPPEGATLLGHHLPGGTIVVNSAYIYHTNSTVFPDPEKWNPARWLVNDTREMEKYWMPFSRGSRICIGMALAEAELSVTLARFVRRFEFGFVEDFDESDMEWLSVFVPATKGKLRVWVKDREE